MVYLLKRGKIPGFGSRQDETSTAQDFELIFKAKESTKTKNFCDENTADLASFKREVFGYHFKDTPNYERLRDILISLRDKNASVDNSTGISSHSNTSAYKWDVNFTSNSLV